MSNKNENNDFDRQNMPNQENNQGHDGIAVDVKISSSNEEKEKKENEKKNENEPYSSQSTD
jgi:hypothetical protein